MRVDGIEVSIGMIFIGTTKELIERNSDYKRTAIKYYYLYSLAE